MNLVLRGLLTSVLTAGLLAPGSALADPTPSTKAPVTSPVVQQPAKGVLHGSDFGPAVYHGGIRKGASREVGTNKSGWATLDVAGDRTAYKDMDRYAWTGLWIYNLSVTGYFHSTGSVIDYYGGSTPGGRAAGWFLWDIASSGSSWTYSPPNGTRGIVTTNATLKHGIPTPWGTIAFETVLDSVDATATP